jgi:hypothetical protein
VQNYDYLLLGDCFFLHLHLTIIITAFPNDIRTYYSTWSLLLYVHFPAINCVFMKWEKVTQTHVAFVSEIYNRQKILLAVVHGKMVLLH